MILVAGVLLLTPGFFTDAVGLSLLLPPVREILIRWGAARIAAGRFEMHGHPLGGAAEKAPQDTVEAEYSVLNDEDPDAPRGTSGWTRHE
jgi:UPF0716 protein FxsA